MGRKNSNLAIQPLLLEHRALLDRKYLMIISCNIVLLRWFVTFFLMLSDLSWVAVCLLWPLIKRKVCVPFDMTPNALEILHQTLNHSSKSPWWQNTGFSSLSLQWQKNCEVSTEEKIWGFNKKLWGFGKRENAGLQHFWGSPWEMECCSVESNFLHSIPEKCTSLVKKGSSVVNVNPPWQNKVQLYNIHLNRDKNPAQAYVTTKVIVVMLQVDRT